MTKPAPLTYRELIAPNRGYRPKVLTPNEIPIHPAVYDSPACFTPEFLERIRGRIVGSMKEDDRIIREVLGIDTGLIIGDRSITRESIEVPYDRIEFMLDPEKKEIGAAVYATSADILRHLPIEIGLSPLTRAVHPMSSERLREYAFDVSDPKDPRIHVWYQHNIYDQGNGVAHFLRNFAILFNNAGLEVA